jgi:hypothetical protein
MAVPLWRGFGGGSSQIYNYYKTVFNHLRRFATPPPAEDRIVDGEWWIVDRKKARSSQLTDRSWQLVVLGHSV